MWPLFLAWLLLVWHPISDVVASCVRVSKHARNRGHSRSTTRTTIGPKEGRQQDNNKTTTTSQPSLSNWSIKSNQRYFQPTYLRRRRRRYKTLIIQFSIIFLVKISTRLLITLIKFYVNQVTFEATKQIGFLNRKQY